MGPKWFIRVSRGGQAIQKGVPDLFWSWIGLAKATTRAPGAPEGSQKAPGGWFLETPVARSWYVPRRGVLCHQKKRLFNFESKNNVSGAILERYRAQGPGPGTRPRARDQWTGPRARDQWTRPKGGPVDRAQGPGPRARAQGPGVKNIGLQPPYFSLVALSLLSHFSGHHLSLIHI